MEKKETEVEGTDINVEINIGIDIIPRDQTYMHASGMSSLFCWRYPIPKYYQDFRKALEITNLY